MQKAGMKPPAMDPPDLKEYGAEKDGVRQTSERRMFFQLQVFTECLDTDALIKPLADSGREFVLYKDVNDPRGVALLSMEEDPGMFAGPIREILTKSPFAELKPQKEMTMMGRTYSLGREPNLEDWMLKKPRRNALNRAYPWAVWYPLRRKPEFALLSREEHGKVLMEHAMIGRSYGEAGYVQDIRLACHGLDKNDNEFVIGLLSSELFPLSKIVQDMRKTQQTSKYIQSLGPFFVGQVVWQSEMK